MCWFWVRGWFPKTQKENSCAVIGISQHCWFISRKGEKQTLAQNAVCDLCYHPASIIIWRGWKERLNIFSLQWPGPDFMVVDLLYLDSTLFPSQTSRQHQRGPPSRSPSGHCKDLDLLSLGLVATSCAFRPCSGVCFKNSNSSNIKIQEQNNSFRKDGLVYIF